MTLEQQIVAALREGNMAIANLLLAGAFGEPAKLWFAALVAEHWTRDDNKTLH